MKRQIIFMLIALGTMVGCATPYQKIKGDQVILHLKDATGQTAFFASSLDGFQRHPLTRQSKDAWRITLPADQEFTYFFILDHQPVIPDCLYKERDDFGFENCIFTPDL